jgi:hypothetical protein
MKDDFTLEKLKIDDRLRKVEEFMASAVPVREEMIRSLSRIEKTVDKLDVKMHGAEGVEFKILELEKAERARIKTNDNIMRVAVGAITTLVGTIVLWVWKLITH